MQKCVSDVQESSIDVGRQQRSKKTREADAERAAMQMS